MLVASLNCPKCGAPLARANQKCPYCGVEVQFQGSVARTGSQDIPMSMLRHGSSTFFFNTSRMSRGPLDSFTSGGRFGNRRIMMEPDGSVFINGKRYVEA